MAADPRLRIVRPYPLDGDSFAGDKKVRNRRQFTQIVLAAIPFTGLASAQTSGGVLKGVVRDPIETPIVNARIVLCAAGGRTFDAKSDSNGAFETTGIPAGSWNFKAEATSFVSLQQTGVVIREGAETTMSFHLRVGSNACPYHVELAESNLPEKPILHK